MKHIQIDNTDIFLENLGVGKGKISITDTKGYNYSHYWGSMGDTTIEEFICGLDYDYFMMKLKPIEDRGVFDSKMSVREIRNFIRGEFKYELPWYKYMEFQKELREKLKEIEQFSYSEEDFVRRCSDIPSSYWNALDYKAEKEFVAIMESLFQEPWHFIVKGDSRHCIFLKNLLPKLKAKLNKL